MGKPDPQAMADHLHLEVERGTGGTETSKYPEEKKLFP
jgi:hypothetical protein